MFEQGGGQYVLMDALIIWNHTRVFFPNLNKLGPTREIVRGHVDKAVWGTIEGK